MDFFWLSTDALAEKKVTMIVALPSPLQEGENRDWRLCTAAILHSFTVFLTVGRVAARPDHQSHEVCRMALENENRIGLCDNHERMSQSPQTQHVPALRRLS